ncbi:NAD-dependent protein deacylase [Solimonas fluminis]|uniref:protein acetyllysine N-acetyltransferase n=1 Tax=Solimonas fluminis TaxID=2086571 RepID=A0A2S5TDP9_9GAMM|nr:NAD-dependent deacylase [Solimonas fluminis]PPE73106.1 NAD-dependent protein deacylase [Solimonas fluminis]
MSPTDPSFEQSLDRAAALLRGARRVLAITGAGISADSGLPTYRGVGGLYEDAATEDGLPIEEALSGSMFRRRPEICWKYIHQLERNCRGARHNAAHDALAALQQGFAQFTVLTQNIDGFHVDAGSADVIEIHGNLRELYCVQCGASRGVPDFSAVENLPPRCGRCGGIERPRVVLFDEMLPEAALRRLQDVLEQGVDAVLSIGTTSVFPYIAAPVLMARRHGAPSIEINPGRSEVSELVDLRLRARAIDVLPALAARLSP